MLSNTEVIVAQIFMTQYVVASLSLTTVSNQSYVQFTEAYQFTEINDYVSEAKAFQRYHQQGDFCVCSK